MTPNGPFMTSKARKKSDRTLGLSTLQDISALILQSHDLDGTISNIVELVANRAHSDVCSLFCWKKTSRPCV